MRGIVPPDDARFVCRATFEQAAALSSAMGIDLALYLA